MISHLFSNVIIYRLGLAEFCQQCGIYLTQYQDVFLRTESSQCLLQELFLLFALWLQVSAIEPSLFVRHRVKGLALITLFNSHIAPVKYVWWESVILKLLAPSPLQSRHCVPDQASSPLPGTISATAGGSPCLLVLFFSPIHLPRTLQNLLWLFRTFGVKSKPSALAFAFNLTFSLDSPTHHLLQPPPCWSHSLNICLPYTTACFLKKGNSVNYSLISPKSSSGAAQNKHLINAVLNENEFEMNANFSIVLMLYPHRTTSYVFANPWAFGHATSSPGMSLDPAPFDRPTLAHQALL